MLLLFPNEKSEEKALELEADGLGLGLALGDGCGEAWGEGIGITKFELEEAAEGVLSSLDKTAA